MATVPAVAEPTRPLPAVATGRRPRGGGWRRGLAVAAFMAPALLFLGAIVGYPTVATIIASFYDKQTVHFVGLDNYRTIFATSDILVAVRNNAIWVIVFPFLVTFTGLVFAVLTERVRWATAFKAIVFMPMAISLFATGVIWRIVYQTDPHRGLINSAVGTVYDAINKPGAYALPNIKPISGLSARPGGSMVSTATVQPGGTVKLGLTGISPEDVPPGARNAVQPPSVQGGVSGVVWRDFSPGGTPGTVDAAEKGLPGMRLDLLRADGSTAATAASQMDGSFSFKDVPAGSYRVALDASNFRAPFQGVNWLGSQSITPADRLSGTASTLLTVPLADIAAIVAMLWMWGGFAMVVIGAGLAALNREVLEAAKIDGATEWQTFRHVTFPLLLPVLIVVFVTMIINVLKIFDIILSLVPEASQRQANVIAVQMWNSAFNSRDYGVGSALAVFLFVLVVPVIVVNIRRIRG